MGTFLTTIYFLTTLHRGGVGGWEKVTERKQYLEVVFNEFQIESSKINPSWLVSKFLHLRTRRDDDKFGRRDRFNGPTSDFKEKEGFKPNVKLEYIDDDGHVLSAKEAFRYLSHKFHGKGPGKNKVVYYI